MLDSCPVKYLDEECKKCGRMRVELWSNCEKICEKCNWDQDKNEYNFDYDL